MGQRHKRERMCAFSQPNLGCCTAELCKAIIVQLKKNKKIKKVSHIQQSGHCKSDNDSNTLFQWVS